MHDVQQNSKNHILDIQLEKGMRKVEPLYRTRERPSMHLLLDQLLYWREKEIERDVSTRDPFAILEQAL